MANAIRWAERNWVTLCLLALFIGSDYKFRTRAADSAISGSIDGFILLELGLYGLVALYLIATWRKPGRGLLHPVVLFGGFYLLVIALSLTRSPYPEFGAARIVEMIILGALTIAVATKATRAHLHRAAHGFLILVALSIVYGLVLPSAPISNQQVGRFTWLAIHPTVSGVFVSIAVVIAFAYIVTYRHERPGPRWPLWVYLVLFAAITAALIATRTRASVLAGVVGLLAVLFLSFRGQRRLELLSASALVLVLVAMTSLPTIEEYFARGEPVEQLATLNSRTDIWTGAIAAVKVEPIYGWGLGASVGILGDREGIGTAHNAAINVAVDLGLVGLVLWIALVLAILVSLVRIKIPILAPDGVATDRSILIGVFIAVHVNGIFYFGPGAAGNVAATWMFMVAGWLLCLRRIDSSPSALEPANYRSTSSP